MNTNLFRKSSIDRVNSPEQLNEYIRVANPSVWLILAAIVALLTGVVIWGVFGTIETTIETGVAVETNTAVCYVSEEDVARLEVGMSVSIENSTGSIKSIAKTPVQIDETFSDYMLYLTGFARGDFCYAVEVEVSGIADGVYGAVITVGSIQPITFVIH